MPFDIGEPGDHESLVEPIYGSWEANVDHALRRSPIDICRSRREKQIVLGNFGLVRVLRPSDGSPLREGDFCMVMPFGRSDPYGYAELVFAYDMPGTIGLLAERTRINSDLLLPIPRDTRFSLGQWAAYARYFTAWDNWRCALACWRAQMPEADPADHLVFGWGGGVVFAELLLAKRAGFRVAMSTGSEIRAQLLRKHGIDPIMRPTGDPATSEDNGAGARTESLSHVDDFAARIAELTSGRGAAIVIDNIGEKLHALSLKLLGRQGVLTTCGWKLDMRISHLRGQECINRRLHVHTHAWRSLDIERIRDFSEEAEWIAPPESQVTYDFDEVPQLARDYVGGNLAPYFPLYRVNEP
ncbi:zinc-binding dehydrogenase [Millisia brevis]|uniref:zinc-binding dehydrogenase n=1 Tax=Millisia brevis TaxID=264148 RepID=UPI000A063B1C|nr:zinc-binding dehydrogenase [Millisia brevis]